MKKDRFTVPIHRANNNDVTVLILAGAYGYRMRSYGPKCLQKLSNGTTILQRQVDNITSVFPKAEIVLVCGHDSDKVIKNAPKGVRIVENQLLDTNDVEEVRLGLNNIISDSVLFIYGDLIFNREAINSFKLNKSTVVVDNNGGIPEDCVGVVEEDGFASIMSYGIQKKWAHIAYISGKELQMLRQFVSNRDKNRLFLFEAINSIIDNEGSFLVTENAKQEIVKIDSVVHLDKLREIK